MKMNSKMLQVLGDIIFIKENNWKGQAEEKDQHG